MPDPNKRWSWRVAVGRGLGGVVGAGATGALMASLGGPVGAPLGAAIAAAGAFTTGFLGTVFGHLLDDPPEERETLGSAALYTAVVSGLLSALLMGLTLDHVAAHPELARQAIFGIGALSAFLASLSKSLLDDMRRAGRPPRELKR